jgi:hypothetical protein
MTDLQGDADLCVFYFIVFNSTKVLIDFGTGALAGTAAAAVTTPADVLKTRQQTAVCG